MEEEVKITDYDIIKEVGSICACSSTLVFSQMIDRSIELEAPKLDVVRCDNIEAVIKTDNTIVVGVHTQILTGVKGQVSLLFTEKSAYEFVSIFRSKEKKHSLLTALGVSAIKEVGNIVVSAYSGAMSLLLDVPVMPSIPMLSSGPLSEVIKFGFNSLEGNHEELYVHTMTFKDELKKISGSFYFLIEPVAVKQITQTLRLQLGKIETVKEKFKGLKGYK